MIRSFKSKRLKRLYEHDDCKSLNPTHVEALKDILSALDAAKKPSDMGPPGFGLHPLKGDLKGFWAVSVSGNWRVIFRFEDGEPVDVDYLDYH